MLQTLTSAKPLWLGAMVLVSLSASMAEPPAAAVLDRIFASERFYIKAEQFGGYFSFVDSVAFQRGDGRISGTYFCLSPGPPAQSSGMLSERELKSIKGMLTKGSGLFTGKCEDEFLTITDGRDTVLLIDRHCDERVILNIRDRFLNKAQDSHPSSK